MSLLKTTKLHVTRNALAGVCIAGTICSAAAAPPPHAKPPHSEGVPVEVVNTADKPVPVTLQAAPETPLPVKETGRTPYQMVYDVDARNSESGGCSDAIPVPDGMTLTITNIGVFATNSYNQVPTVDLRITRSGGSVSSHTLRSQELHFAGHKASTRFYSGNYNVNVFAGAASGGVSFAARICVSSLSDVRGIISGYVEETEIIDGNSLQ